MNKTTSKLSPITRCLSSSLLMAMVGASASTGQSISTTNQQPIKTIASDGSFAYINGDGTYNVHIKGQRPGRKRQIDNMIHLRRGGSFDPLKKSAANRLAVFDQNNRTNLPQLYMAHTDNNVGAYIVQFKTQTLPVYQQKIKQLGGSIATAFPPNSVLVLMHPQKLSQLKGQKSVRAIVPFLPIYKLQEGLEQRIASADEQAVNFSILAVDKTHTAKLQKYVESIGGSVVAADKGTKGSRFSANLTPQQLLSVAQNSATLFVDELGSGDEEDIDDVRERGGYNWLESVAGYAGQGVGIEVYDRGFDINHAEVANIPSSENGGIIVRSPAASDPSGEGSKGQMDHGTDVSGILFAQGVDPKYLGILHKASRPIVFSRYSGFGSDGQPDATSLRNHLAELVDPNGPYRAVVQTSSTDYTTTLDYTTWSAEVDEVLFDLDLVKTQSQSNQHDQRSRPGAWSKNMVSVGGIKTLGTLTRSDDGWNNGASIGPAADDRIKPDLSGQYDSFDMIADGGGYNSRSGTSFSTPATAGAFGILFQMWADGVFDGGPGKQGAPLFRDVFDVRPHATTAKAMMVHTAFQYGFDTGDSHNLSRIKQGWGFPDVKNLYETAQNNNWSLPILVNEDDVVLPGGSNSYTITLDGATPLKATMVFKDPRGNPASSIARINDLSLKVTSPSGTVYWGNNGLRQGIWSTPNGTSNTIDTVENVFIQTPQAGVWSIEVLGDDIVQDSHIQTAALDADYALVVTGGSTTPGVNQPPVANAGVDSQVELSVSASLAGSCIDDGLPSGTPTASWSGPGQVAFANANSANTTATFSAAGNYTLTLTCNDSLLTGTDTTQIAVVDSLPVLQSETFETSLGNWSNPSSGDSHNWTRNSGSTASSGTGPTDGADSSYYMYLETSSSQANSSGDTAILESGVLSGTNRSFSFDYHMYGADIGTLDVQVSVGGGSWTNVWSVSGEQHSSNSAAYSSASIDLSGYSGTIKIRFLATAAGGYKGDIAIDNTVLGGNVDPNAPSIISSSNFESGFGDWGNTSSGDNFDWTRDSNGTPSDNTGPSAGANSNYYLFMETSSSQAYDAGETVYLESIDLGGSNRTLDFDYHMYGSDTGTLSVDVYVNGSWQNDVWQISGQQHSSNSAAYSHANVTLTSYSGTIKLRFRATAAGGYKGDIAIDNLVVSTTD